MGRWVWVLLDSLMLEYISLQKWTKYPLKLWTISWWFKYSQSTISNLSLQYNLFITKVYHLVKWLLSCSSIILHAFPAIWFYSYSLTEIDILTLVDKLYLSLKGKFSKSISPLPSSSPNPDLLSFLKPKGNSFVYFLTHLFYYYW